MHTVYNNTHNTCKNESKHSEMGRVRQNPIQRTISLFICVCIGLCTTVAHNIAQNRPDSFPPYPPDDHHISDDVYLREGGRHFWQLCTNRIITNSFLTSITRPFTFLVHPYLWNYHILLLFFCSPSNLLFPYKIVLLHQHHSCQAVWLY